MMNFQMPLSQNFRQLGGQPTFGQNPPMHFPLQGPTAPNAPYGGMWGSQPPMGGQMFGGQPYGGQLWGGQPTANPIHPQPIMGGNFGGIQAPNAPAGGIDLNRLVDPRAQLAQHVMANFGYRGGQ